MRFSNEFARFINQNKLPRLPKDDDAKLLKLAKYGDQDAIMKHFWSNIGLVTRKMNKLGSGSMNHRIDEFDIFQQIFEGYMEAVKYSKEEYAFSSTFEWAVNRLLTSQTITMRDEWCFPYHYYEMELNLSKGKRPEDKWNVIPEIEKNKRARFVRLDQYLFDDQKTRPEIAVRSFSELSESKVFRQSIRSRVKAILNPREATVIIHRFGMNGNHPKTLVEVGQLLISKPKAKRVETDIEKLTKAVLSGGVSSKTAVSLFERIISNGSDEKPVSGEYVRQIEKKVLAKIRKTMILEPFKNDY